MNANLSPRGAKSPDKISVGEPDTIGQVEQLSVSKATLMCERGLRIFSIIGVIEIHEFPWDSSFAPANKLFVLEQNVIT
jgi:hypothetical protein